MEPSNVTPFVAPDKELMLQHLTLLFGRALRGKIEITAISTDPALRPWTRFFEVDELPEAAEWAAKVNSEHGWNVYVGAALRRDDVFPGKAADDGAFHSTWVLFADADDAEQVAGAREKYRELGLTPALVVVTGRQPTTRTQLWWPLEEPLENADHVRAALRGIAATLGTDPKVCTAKQLMRLAGGVSWPKANKEGRVIERTELHRPSEAQQQFSVEQLARAFPPIDRAEVGLIPQVLTQVARSGGLGLDEKIVDGREGYAFRLVRAHLHELIGTTGAEPEVSDLYASVAPVYFAKTEQSRPGRGPAFLMQKCVEALRAFRAGQIPYAHDLDEAVATYAARRNPEISAADDEFQGFDKPPADLFEVLSIGEIKALPDPEWLVDDTIPETGLGFVYGAPGSYKTFICYDLALSIAYGLDEWAGRKLKRKGSVLYIAAEGAAGFKHRIRAWQAKRGLAEDSADFRLIRHTMSFMAAADIDRLERTVAAVVEAGGPVSVVFVDTVSRVLPGADENLQKDMTLFIAACDRIRERFGATVIGVHHTNKAGEMRGSTVFLGQGDFVLRVERNEERTGGVIVCEKQKEAEDGWRLGFKVEPVAWAAMGSDKPVSSLTIEFLAEAPIAEDQRRWPPPEVLRAMVENIQRRWDEGRPLSTSSLATGRVARTVLAHDHRLSAKLVDEIIGRWLAASPPILRNEEYDRHSKAKGLRVVGALP